MPESQLHSDVDAAAGAVEGEAADVIDETSGFADEPGDEQLAADEADDAAAEARTPPSPSSLTRSPSSLANCACCRATGTWCTRTPDTRTG